MTKLRVLDLFSGIGGFSLGLERTGGFETTAFCEIEEFPRRVLAKHWPHVPCYDDVRTLTAARLAADGIGVDVICGGFPCQDISVAGKRVGIEGERSGLWSEYARLIDELRPAYVLVENVAALLGRGLDRVLGDLASLGYDAEWHCIPASAVGAWHIRDRLWLVAYPDSGRAHIEPQRVSGGQGEANARGNGAAEYVADSNSDDGDRRRRILQMGWGQRALEIAAAGLPSGDEWSAEPAVGRVVHGVSNRVDRLKGLGNAVVPQIPELIGNAILASMREAA